MLVDYQGVVRALTLFNGKLVNGNLDRMEDKELMGKRVDY
jgi:hypothetical protein